MHCKPADDFECRHPRKIIRSEGMYSVGFVGAVTQSNRGAFLRVAYVAYLVACAVSTIGGAGSWCGDNTAKKHLHHCLVEFGKSRLKLVLSLFS
jgi:hypothetical protein